MKILSNKEYKKLKDAEFDSTMYYNECETLRNRKEELLKEKIELVKTIKKTEKERDMYNSDFIKVEEICKNYKRQIEEYTIDSIVKDERIEELQKENKKLKSQITELNKKIPEEKKTTKKSSKKEK